MTQKQKYGYHKSTGRLPEEAPKEVKGYGVLEMDGKPISEPAAYALLQFMRKQHITNGINPKRLKIRKHYER